MKQKAFHSIIIILSFLFAFFGKNLVNLFIKISISSYSIRIIYNYIWWIIPPIISLGYLFGFKKILNELRLNKGFLFGFIFSFIAVLPMLLSSYFLGEINNDLQFIKLFHTTFLAGFFEEVLFRAFLFGILFRKLNWGFIPAAIIGAIVFGLGHLYQGSTFIETISIFMITAIGALWFSWLFIEWNENIWIPIFLHILMNLSWILFEIENNALGGLISNIFRVTTISLTIFATIIHSKRRNIFYINGKNLFVNY